MTNNKIIWWIIFSLMIIYVIWDYSLKDKLSNDKDTDDLASCLKNKGVKFYGAVYCGYCTKQKQMFGENAKNLPYIECESPKNPECSNNNITGYPTWIFPNGKKISGLLTIEQLKSNSGC